MMMFLFSLGNVQLAKPNIQQIMKGQLKKWGQDDTAGFT
jgi:hypothetical protein